MSWGVSTFAQASTAFEFSKNSSVPMTELVTVLPLSLAVLATAIQASLAREQTSTVSTIKGRSAGSISSSPSIDSPISVIVSSKASYVANVSSETSDSSKIMFLMVFDPSKNAQTRARYSTIGSGVGVGVMDGVAVGVGVSVGSAVGVWDGVTVGIWVAVAGGIAVAVAVGIGVAEAVGVGGMIVSVLQATKKMNMERRMSKCLMSIRNSFAGTNPGLLCLSRVLLSRIYMKHPPRQYQRYRVQLLGVRAMIFLFKSFATHAPE